MKRFNQRMSGLLMAMGLTAALPVVADEVVAYATGGWFAVDSREVKDTTLAGGAIVGGKTELALQSSPNAWGEAGGGESATITWQSAKGSGTVAEATTASEVEWTPEVRSGVNTLTYLSGSVEKTAQFVASEQVGDGVVATILDGVCTISGTGATWNFSNTDNPLDASWASVKDVVVADGVTGLGAYTFYKFYNLTNMTVAASVTNLGKGSVYLCHSLESVSFLGTSVPTMAENVLNLKAGIVIKGVEPVVTLVPKVTVGGKSPTLMGTNDLTDKDSWVTVTKENVKQYHFFKYVIQ